MPSLKTKKKVEKKDWDTIKAKLPVKRSKEDKNKRLEMWRSFDSNGNGYMSLAEVDLAIRKFLACDELLDAQPAIFRAFAYSAALGDDDENDDYITFKEFRMFLAKVKENMEVWQVFTELDAGGGRADGRITEDEFCTQRMIDLLEAEGIKIDKKNMRQEFKNVNAMDGGVRVGKDNMISYDEFLLWFLEKKEEDLDADSSDDDTKKIKPKNKPKKK